MRFRRTGQHRVDPGSGDVDDDRRLGPKRLAGQDVVTGNARCVSAGSEDALDLMVGPQLRAMGTGVERIFQRQSFREGGLSIVIERGGTEPPRHEARRPPLCGAGIEHLVPG